MLNNPNRNITASMHKYFSMITKLFQPKNTILLGRWKPEYNKSIISSKVYWANNDHCGTCDIKLKPKEDYNDGINEVLEKDK